MWKRVILAGLFASGSVGCLGTNGLSGQAREMNLKAVENRWAREGLYAGLQVLWVYRICTVLDLFLFNPIEFWSGTNPLNGKSALAEIPPSQIEKLGFKEVDRATVEFVTENQSKLHLDFKNGDRMALDVVRRDQQYSISYLGRVLFRGSMEPEAWQ